MKINCKNILALPYANQMKLVAGEKGKWNIISNVHVVEEMTLLDFVDEGELIISMGCKLTENIEEWKYLIENCYSRKAAGFVLCLGYCLKTTPVELKKCCDELEFPLFELRSELRISNVIYNIYQAMFREAEFHEARIRFFEDLIQNMGELTVKKLQRARKYGYDPNKTYDVVVIDVVRCHQDILDVKKEIKTVCEFDYLQRTETEMNVFLSGRCNDALIFRKIPHIVILMPIAETESNYQLIMELYSYLCQESIEIKIGVGSKLEQLWKLRESYDKALYSLKIISMASPKPVLFYEDMKIQTILYEMKDRRLLKLIMNNILGELLECDKEQNMDLYQTLEKYFENDCNVTKAATNLYIHTNTLRYRLERIENILGSSLKNINTLFDLRLAIAIKEFLEMIDADN